MDKHYKLVYFNIRGLAEPIRWMFRMKNVKFEDEKVDLNLWSEQKHRKDYTLFALHAIFSL